MYFSDHAPPHFHAIYAQHEAEVAIATGEVLKGRLPRRASALVHEWLEAHRGELFENWDRAQDHQPLIPVPPLD